jgi:hypothetical protein
MLKELVRIQPRELHEHFLRGSQLDRSTLRQEVEQLHQAWPWSGLAHFGPTTPKQFRMSLATSVDPTDARNVARIFLSPRRRFAQIRAYGRRIV